MPFAPAPLVHTPERVVENVFPTPGMVQDMHPDHPPVPDVHSQTEMESFLGQRMQGDQPVLRQANDNGGYLVYNTVEETPLRFDRWAYLSPVKTGRGWRIATAAGLLAFNIIPNLLNRNIQDNVANAVDDMGEEISAILDPWEIHGEADLCERPGANTFEHTTTTITESYFYAPNRAGQSDPNVGIVDEVLDRIEAAQADGTVKSIELTWGASTSDEWRSLGEALNHGIDKPDQPNIDLGQEREEDSATLLEQRAFARGIDIEGINVTVLEPDQHVFSPELEQELTEIAIKYGFDSIIDVLNARDKDPDSLPPELASVYARHFDQNRDTEFRVRVERETTNIIRNNSKSEIEKDGCGVVKSSPEDENHDYDFDWYPFLWPGLPLFMRRRIERMRGVPVDLGDLPNPQRLLIHRDGVHPDHELQKSAWAYVRKYMYLFREDDRISKVYEHYYMDANGEAQTLRALFVDHDPTEATVAMVARTFQLASQINGGRLGKDCDAVVIYPSDNAGLHGDPKRVGLGLDVQYQGTTLGVAIPSLGLVELHMPELPDGDELDQTYRSAAHTLAHELAGHMATDLNEEPNILAQVGQTAAGKNLFVLPDRFAGFGRDQYDRAVTQETGNDVGRRMRWTLRRGRGTRPSPHEATPIEHDVHGVNDRALRESLFVRKQTGNPTNYGSSVAHPHDPRTGAAEALAEAAASEFNPQIDIPWAQAPEAEARGIVTDTEQGQGFFATGYHVSDDWRRVLAQRWGSSLVEDGVSFPNQGASSENWTHEFGAPENFPFYRDLARWARSVEVFGPNDPVWTEIIVGQRTKKP